uniref:NADH dehydrogenase subunit 2 n=1 Tax=Kuohzygia albolinea TaxID=3019669 RepID=UPI0030020EEA
MTSNSSKILFYSTMMMGIMMTISSSNWIMMWCGLEISLISIIPLMISKMMMSSESTMKYFIVQSISSAMLMMAMLIMIMKGDYNYNFMLSTSLLIKTGVAPFHNWVLTVIEGLDLWLMLIVLSINKISPLTLISYTTTSLIMIIWITLMTGSMMGLNQNSMKKIIGYSSIFNMGLIIMVIKSNLMWMYYLLIYSAMLTLITKQLNDMKTLFINQSVFLQSKKNKFMIWINLLSMGGMPPLLGFSIKYMTINQMINYEMISLIVFMVMSSLLVMFFYLRITFLSIMTNSLIIKTMIFKLNMTPLWMSTLTTISLPLVLLMKPLM